MEKNLLLLPHNISVGDDVIVTDRRSKSRTFYGSVYRIENKSMNPYIQDQKYVNVDYFYIQFSNDDYDKILVRGLEVIYDHKSVILGDIIRDSTRKITKLYIQNMYSPVHIEPKQIYLENMNAVNIWRAGWDIQKI